MPKAHIALYGNVKIPRSWCKDCESWAFVMDNKFACCGGAFSQSITKFRRMCEPVAQRKQLKKKEKLAILLNQDYSCFYCEHRFDSTVELKKKQVRLKIEWDHLVPFSFTQNNSAVNFVAACQLCNGWKASNVFQTVEEAKVYLYEKWKKAERN